MYVIYRFVYIYKFIFYRFTIYLYKITYIFEKFGNFRVAILIKFVNFWVVILRKFGNFWVAILIKFVNFWVVIWRKFGNFWVAILIKFVNFWIVILRKRQFLSFNSSKSREFWFTIRAKVGNCLYSCLYGGIRFLEYLWCREYGSIRSLRVNYLSSFHASSFLILSISIIQHLRSAARIYALYPTNLEQFRNPKEKKKLIAVNQAAGTPHGNHAPQTTRVLRTQ